MLSLYLIRHAKSSWSDATLSDFERPLNARGKKAAPFMGKKLKERNEGIGLFVSSPAKRAISTARVIAEELGLRNSIVQNEAIYHASTSGLLQLVNGLNDEHKRVAVVGHNPGFTDLSDYLCGAGISNIPTAGIVRIDFDLDSWTEVSKDTGTLNWFDYPKRYPELER